MRTRLCKDIRTRAQLAFLSPTIQRAILAGHQPPDLTLERIIRKPVPLNWDAQARLYWFDGGNGPRRERLNGRTQYLLKAAQDGGRLNI